MARLNCERITIKERATELIELSSITELHFTLLYSVDS